MDEQERIWVCQLCGQRVTWAVGSKEPWLPRGYFEACKLRGHMVGIECVAYRDVPTAKRLLLQA
jgi:hypothetical protein